MTRSELSGLLKIQLFWQSPLQRQVLLLREQLFTGALGEKGHTGPGWFSVLSFPLVILLDMENI